MSDAPLYIEPAIAWRVWITHARYPRLLSVTSMSVQKQNSENTWRQQWPYQMRFEAKCQKGHDHAAPEEECACGIYGTASFFEAWEYLTYNERNNKEVKNRAVIGTVKLWGDVLEYTSGYKAQFAYPQEVWLPPCSWQIADKEATYDESVRERLADDLADAYGITTHVVETWRDIEAWNTFYAGQHQKVPDQWLVPPKETPKET